MKTLIGILPHIFDPDFRQKLPHYAFQCALAAISLVFILVIGNTIARTAIVVGIASSAYTVFVIPHSIAATPRRVIGGHIVAIVTSSLLIGSVSITSTDTLGIVTTEILAAISVGIAILIMVITDTEHPPAAGTSLGLIFNHFGLESIMFVVFSAVILSIIRLILKDKMVNLI
jgi:CBS-domain-containing membrane protein